MPVEDRNGYEAVRTGAALFGLEFRARLRFTGADRVSFLHNLLSNDVRSLHPGSGCYSAILTQQSRVVGDANVVCAEDETFLDLEIERRERVRQHLEKHLVAEEVEIEDLAPLEATIGIHGRRAAECVAAIIGELPQSELDHRVEVIAGTAVRVVRVHWTGEPGFDLWTPRAASSAVREAVLAAGEDRGLRPASLDVFEVLRVEAGIPRAGIDFDESHLALEAALERGIHFRKGCYLGQEVVERQSARGHVNRRRVGLRLDGTRAPERGARILHAADEVGTVTSGVFSPALARAIAMGYVRREVMEPGSRLMIEAGSESIPAEVVRLPFVTGDD